MAENLYTEITPLIKKYADYCESAATIVPNQYTQYDVKRGLRDLNGKGVLV